jgi:hypothetical protein
MLVWQQLANRLAVAREGRYPAQLLLTALKLTISAIHVAPPCRDGRYAVVITVILITCGEYFIWR